VGEWKKRKKKEKGKKKISSSWVILFLRATTDFAGLFAQEKRGKGGGERKRGKRSFARNLDSLADCVGPLPEGGKKKGGSHRETIASLVLKPSLVGRQRGKKGGKKGEKEPRTRLAIFVSVASGHDVPSNGSGKKREGKEKAFQVAVQIELAAVIVETILISCKEEKEKGKGRGGGRESLEDDFTFPFLLLF